MRFMFDMVHHNPGEPHFSTAFQCPEHLIRYGFNGQVFKHLNCAVTFAATGVDVFPQGSQERSWLEDRTARLQSEIAAAKAKGLAVFYHIDLFVLPRRLVERYKSEICDPVSGNILLDRARTIALHQIMFDEMAARFPEVDGYVVRVGETYLFDTPYHVGNGAVPPVGPAWSADYLYTDSIANSKLTMAWGSEQVASYVSLLRFLREVVCERLDRYVFFRTWDIFPDKLHARLDHYLQVSDQIEPHSKLLFSIKHTALDFWRRVKVNECLGKGQHEQVIEVQCQREYEGKGAFPNYFMDRLIDGFEENAQCIGLRHLVSEPKIQGIFSWSRGGGWYGPSIENELWPDINMYVLGKFANQPTETEANLFRRYAKEILWLSDECAEKFRELCLLTSPAILKGRYCEPFDMVLREELLPTANWMRDDRLGGRHQLKTVLDLLVSRSEQGAALAEKEEAVELWTRIEKLAGDIAWADAATGSFVRISSSYGRILFSVIVEGWRVMLAGTVGEKGGSWDTAAIIAAATRYRQHWREYCQLATSADCPSLFLGCYLFRTGDAPVPGLDETVAYYEEKAKQVAIECRARSI